MQSLPREYCRMRSGPNSSAREIYFWRERRIEVSHLLEEITCGVSNRTLNSDGGAEGVGGRALKPLKTSKEKTNRRKNKTKWANFNDTPVSTRTLPVTFFTWKKQCSPVACAQTSPLPQKKISRLPIRLRLYWPAPIVHKLFVNGRFFAIYKKFPEKSGWKVNGTWFFWSFQRKISGSKGTSERVVLFFRMEYSKRKYSCSISSKPSLIPVSSLRGRFTVNRTDLHKW